MNAEDNESLGLFQLVNGCEPPETTSNGSKAVSGEHTAVSGGPEGLTGTPPTQADGPPVVKQQLGMTIDNTDLILFSETNMREPMGIY